MNPDANAHFLRYRRHLLDEMRVVLPDLFLREDPAMRQRLTPLLAIPDPDLVRAAQIEFACRRAPDLSTAAVPDAVAHMRVRGVVNPRRAKIAQVLLVFF